MLGLWTLEEQRNRADLIEVFKIMRGFFSVPLESFFELSKDGRTRGHSLKLAKHQTKICTTISSMNELLTLNRWNQLDKDTVEASSLNSF